MDIQRLMRQAQEMQNKMQKAQAELAEKLYNGSAGGDMVKVTIQGDGTAKKVEIDKTLINEEEKDVLEDLIVAAFNNAKDQADNASSDLMKSATAGMKLPAGFKI